MEDKTQEGHRQRLRQKFLKAGLAGFHDYEIVEMLLTLGRTRSDCKRQAKEAIKKFKTLRGVLAASPEELQEIEGIGPASIFSVRLIQEVAQEFLKEKVLEKPFCKSSKEVYDYLNFSMRDLSKELFKGMFLNAQNQIIEVENLFEGTLTASAIYHREIVEKAIKHNAAALIFAHNHPSGNPEPSNEDKQITRDLVFVGNVMQIKVLDHIIIGDNKYFSFADAGLLEKYNLDFSSQGKKR
ncbi:MAG TPA: DNA repair protein RadC [Dehalococcoidia bacterium]|nr:DNA repair protein RadC [Dehalococcoidia bacterium]